MVRISTDPGVRIRPRGVSLGRVGLASMLALLIAGGCRANSPGQPFAEVQQEVRRRGGLLIEWNRSAGAAEIDAAVRELLARELTVDAAVQVALLNNRRLQAEYALLGLAQADLVQAGLLRNPVFQGAFQWAPGSQRIFDFAVVQDFLDVLLIPLEVEVARTELESTKLEIAGEVIDVAGATKHAFYDYVANERAVSLWQARLTAAESAYEMAQQLQRAGNSTALDVLREQAAYEQSKLDLARVESRRVPCRERLNRLMGLWGPDTAWTAANDLPPLPDTGVECASVERLALASSLDVQRAYLQIEAAAKRFRVLEVLEVIPTFELGGGLEFEKEESFKLVEHRRRSGTKYELEEVPGPTETWSGPRLDIALPLWDQGQAARAAGRAEIERRYEGYTALAIETRSAARELAYRTASSRQRAVFQRDVYLPLRQAITQETQLRYNAMFDGVFQLLRAKEQELQAQLEYVGALHEFWQAQADLEQLLMGSLPAEFRTARGMQRGRDGGPARGEPGYRRLANVGADREARFGDQRDE